MKLDEPKTAADFAVGDRVNVVPLPDDQFTYEFTGRVSGFRNGLIQVTDQDDDTWEVTAAQLFIV